jgi:DNA-directed RNA polymerase subunit F
MILEKKPLSFAEVKEYVSEVEEAKSTVEYLKKFSKLSKDKSKKLKEEVMALKNPKIREDGIVKLADFLPTQPEEIHKIFTDASLTEEETNAILEITKKY